MEKVNENPLVSVIITTCKRCDFLKQTISSVLNQTYSNIEIIVVDDNNLETEYRSIVIKICNSFESDKIKYLPMPKNSGACIARNFGFQHSKGEYVNFLDDDDYFEPDKIELQINLAKELNYSYGMIFF